MPLRPDKLIQQVKGRPQPTVPLSGRESGMPHTENITIELDQELEEMWEGIEYASKNPKDTLKQWKDEQPRIPIPEMLPSSDGKGGVLITINARNALYKWLRRQYDSDGELNKVLSYEEWVRYARANMLKYLSDEADTAANAPDPKADAKNINQRLKSRLKSGAKGMAEASITHIFAACYAREPLTQICDLGLVCLIPPNDAENEIHSIFRSSSQNQSNFFEMAYEDSLKVVNRWKEEATCFMRIKLEGLGPAYSEQWARISARLSLSALLLPFGADAIRRSYFLDEPVRPLREEKLKFKNAQPSSPSFSFRMPNLRSGDFIVEDESGYKGYKEALSNIFKVYLTPNSNLWNYPNLAKNWLSSIHWFSRAVKTEFDFESVVNLGTSLDVLTEGGKAKGITDVTASLFKVHKDNNIFRNPDKTLDNFIKEIYNKGRSRIIHGTREGLRENLSRLRQQGEVLTWNVLLAFGNSLIKYQNDKTGEDNIKSFLKFLV